MHLTFIDWAIIAAFLVISFSISFYYRKVAEKGLTGFFLGGRNLPWYLAGISMVATTFAADTPLAVTEIVASKGIAGNWLWWSFILGGMLTAVFFSRLWRRSGVVTELELIDLRYSGKGAKYLRKLKAIYLGLFMNALVIAWVNKALISLLHIFFDIPENELIWWAGGAMIFVAAYSSISGLMGVAVTDAFQFILAMIGCIVLAVLVLQSEKIGGIVGLKEKLDPNALNFFPTFGDESGGFSLGMPEFIAFAGVIWWSSWYPGQEPGGGGYVAQRMMSTKNEKHSLLATLFFQAAHYCLRPWPWIIVGLAAIVLYPELGVDDKKLGYVMAMKEFLPPGLTGLMLAAFFGAYMSTISTQLNWGASFIVNDLLDKKDSESSEDNKQTIKVSRIVTFIIMFISLYITTLVGSIKEVWEFILECGAGLGLVLLLRWFWWRINVWSEISATVAPFAIFGLLKLLAYNGIGGIWVSSPYSIFVTVAGTTVIWILVTFLTKPTDKIKLEHFHALVQPMGAWGNLKVNNQPLPYLSITWLGSIFAIIGILFSTGSLILQIWNVFWYYAALTLVGFLVFIWGSKKAGLFKD
jgi:SSS family solute:Na+ symporter